MKAIEIRVVKNGFVAMAPHEGQAQYRLSDEMHVFETFESLVLFLNANINSLTYEKVGDVSNILKSIGEMKNAKEAHR